uniref:Uncharacterized protein n=1 Tax=Glossina austeni TaxID=7395 RepID=A0A1A9VRL6_GLOAU
MSVPPNVIIYYNKDYNIRVNETLGKFDNGNKNLVDDVLTLAAVAFEEVDEVDDGDSKVVVEDFERVIVNNNFFVSDEHPYLEIADFNSYSVNPSNRSAKLNESVGLLIFLHRRRPPDEMLAFLVNRRRTPTKAFPFSIKPPEIPAQEQ